MFLKTHTFSNRFIMPEYAKARLQQSRFQDPGPLLFGGRGKWWGREGYGREALLMTALLRT